MERLDDDKRQSRSDAMLETGMAIELVYRTEAPRLARYLRRRLRAPEDAADLVQEAFARLARSARIGSLGEPRAYLRRIVQNLLIDRSRRLSTRAIHVDLENGPELSVQPDQSYALEAADVIRLYRSAVAALPPRTRQVFELHRVAEHSYKDIAADLGISIRTVEWHIATALAHIDKVLNKE